jgi:hypothetical protein
VLAEKEFGGDRELTILDRILTAALVILERCRLPLKKDELGTEGGAHGCEDAVSSGLAGGVDEDVFEDRQNRSSGEIADFTQASPGGFERVGGKIESVFHGFEDLGAPGVEDVARDVI